MSGPDFDLSAAEVAERLAAVGSDECGSDVAALTAFLTLLSRWNRVYNLTGIRNPAELVDRHLIESLALKPFLRGTRIADVGSGAGLPGLPLAIVEPGRDFTLIESRAKRVRFLRHVIGELGLANARVAHSRAEHLRPDRPFDTVLARAVAPPAELLAVCRPLTAPGSVLLLLTAAHLQQAFRGLAPDWTVRAGEPLTVGSGESAQRSSIVLLERTDG